MKARVAPHARRNAISPIAQPTIDGATGARSRRSSGDRSETRAGRTKVAASSCSRYTESVQGRAEGGVCSRSYTPQHLLPCTHLSPGRTNIRCTPQTTRERSAPTPTPSHAPDIPTCNVQAEVVEETTRDAARSKRTAEEEEKYGNERDEERRGQERRVQRRSTFGVAVACDQLVVGKSSRLRTLARADSMEKDEVGDEAGKVLWRALESQ